jgi:hypothetical protein
MNDIFLVNYFDNIKTIKTVLVDVLTKSGRSPTEIDHMVNEIINSASCKALCEAAALLKFDPKGPAS